MRAAWPGRRYASGLLYAESTDNGGSFTKPNLGLIPWGPNNNTANNIVFRAERWAYQDGISVLLDAEDPDPSRRWKLVSSATTGAGYPCRPLSQFCTADHTWTPLLATSADGLDWREWTAINDTGGRWDT